MKKRFLPAIFLLMSITAVFAQIDKLNLVGRIKLREYKDMRSLMHAAGQRPSSGLQLCLIEIKTNGDLSELEKRGIYTCDRIGDILVAKVPVDSMESVLALDIVRRVSFGDKAVPMMDYARPSGIVNDVQNGFEYNSVNHSFTGKGVVTGLMDVGIDPNHINFKDKSGSLRVKRVFHMTGSDGSFRAYSTPELIRSFTTDNPSETHGTHVAGIMAGGYRGNGTYSHVSSPTGTRAVVKDGDIPYYGVAYDSEIAMSCGTLYDENIISGISNIMDFAETEGKPVVVNISLGSTSGPHDGTSLSEKALAALGERGIICVSAGNDGDVPMSLVQKFSESNMEIKTIITNAGSESEASGLIDIWNSNQTSLKVSLLLIDRLSYKSTILGTIDQDNPTATISGGEFGKYFSGKVNMICQLNSGNNRFQSMISCNFKTLASNERMLIGFSVSGENGSTAYIYGSSNVCFRSMGVSGFKTGNAANSINDFATANNVISVGSYTTRRSWGVLTGSAFSYTSDSYIVGEISPFSSYGRKFNGPQLPNVTAPGACIISSYSTPYVQSKNIGLDGLTAKVTENSKNYWWAGTQGTSMSCPFVSGVVGLWLEASPNLTCAQILEIIKETSGSIPFGSDAGRWGAGKIDALAGVKYVLQKYAANGAVWEDDEQRLIVTPNGAGYDVTMAGEASFAVTVYDIQGRPVATARGTDGQASVATSDLTAGIYVLTAQGASSRLTRKITVR